MYTRLINVWNHYVEADRRQLPLFPEWERAQWMRPLPAVGAALGLALLFAVWTPPADTAVPIGAVSRPLAEVLVEEDTAAPAYDLDAIPDHIRAAAKRYHLSEELITAVISVESNFDHAAVSHKGARGLMQLMPQTSAMIGVHDPHDPDENIDAGASHLRAMLDTFNNNLPLALAAYNAGEQNVLRYKGVPPFPETRRFVARVLRRMGQKQTAERALARPVPSPRWISRVPRPQPAVQMVSGAPARPVLASPESYGATARVPGPEHGPQVLVQDSDSRPSPRPLLPAAPPVTALDAAPAPAPTAPIGQSP
ncbi:MAG TPA: lytic transglycosylase domain-containing protein [Methylomirabilota bacterium]|nr:lytic transglycosylase domain-containing protein [Methylomirabilota bacterium]